MYVPSDFDRCPNQALYSERDDISGRGPSLRLTFLGFALVLTGLLGSAILLPPSAPRVLAGNAVTAAP